MHDPHSRYRKLAMVQVGETLTVATRPPVPVDRFPVALHVFAEGETLDLLARKYYGRESLWWRIADANPRRDAYAWQPGDILRIPAPGSATRTPREGR